MRLRLSRLARANFITSNIGYYSNIIRATRVISRVILDLKNNILLIYNLFVKMTKSTFTLPIQHLFNVG